MLFPVRYVVRLSLFVLCCWPALQVPACPFCRAPALTLSQQIEQADTVKLLKLETRLASAPDAKPVVGRFRVIDEFTRTAVKTDNDLKLKVERLDGKLNNNVRRLGSTKPVLRLQLAPDWKVGDLFVLFQVGSPDDDVPLLASRSVWSYLKSAPLRGKATPDRLRYFVRYLEHADVMIANDAYGEFANAPYEEIVKMRDALPIRKLRQWVDNSRVNRRTIKTRLGLYGLLLGLCGEPSDAAMLKRVIVDDWKPDSEFRLGIDGLIGGYLLLAGDAGLDVIRRSKIEDSKVPFPEMYAAMQAMRFAWTYAEGVVDRDRLRKVMRLLLDRPELADLVISDLARWRDWEIQPRLMKLYDEDEYQIAGIKRAIIRFMLASSRSTASQSADKGKSANSSLPESTSKTRPNAANEPDKANDVRKHNKTAVSEPAHVTQSRRYLAILRARDPKLVAQCERFFITK